MNISLLYVNYLLFQLQIYLIYSHLFTISPLFNKTNLIALQDKNRYKLDKLCDIVNINHLDNTTLTHYTYLKYYYDFFRPYRRVCDLKRIIHFRKLNIIRKTALVVKILFYVFYYSL